MKEGQGQHIEQQMTQRQWLSPQQVQFMRLLEMNSPALEEEVQRQIDDNPALESVDNDGITGAGENDNNQQEYNDTDPDDDPADYIGAWSGNTFDIAPIASNDTPDLYTWLHNQLGETELSKQQRDIAEYILGNIDENGYLTRSLEEISDDLAITTGIDYSKSEIHQVLQLIQTFDPPGVGARNPVESLTLQLDRLPVSLETRIAKDILDKYTDLLEKKHFDKLQNRLGVSRENLGNALDLIRHLNPKPGQALSITRYEQLKNHITPEIGVDYDNGRFSVYLNNHIPALQIERSFAVGNSVESNDRKPSQSIIDAQSFIRSKRNEAETFIAALKQRSKTLLTVAEAIVRLQHEFFRSGDEADLKPMILEDIKAITGLDVSVISRATQNKYIETATGTYPLKMFFNEAPTDNPGISVHTIKDKIKSIVDNEDKKHPLSDDAIVTMLADVGLNIARRTVTKYRKDMNIPDSRMRKSFG